MTDEEAALEWLRNYHGSIDSTALLLAYRAGARRARSEALEEAAKVAESKAETDRVLDPSCIAQDTASIIASAVRARKGEGEEG